MNNVEEDILKGTPASQGIVRGSVCLVLNETNLSKLQKGDVLVAHITNPSFTPFMGIASAVVTEVGSVLSHAAIVSRELRIPCIVAVTNATKVLKDGDDVEVDADKGMVRIIKKASASTGSA